MTPKEKEMKLEVELLGAGVDSPHSQNFNFEKEVYSFLLLFVEKMCSSWVLSIVIGALWMVKRSQLNRGSRV